MDTLKVDYSIVIYLILTTDQEEENRTIEDLS
jgi:hypothetical protein